MRGKTVRMRTGWLVALALAILTGIEYWLAVSLDGSIVLYLVVIAVIKAWLIVQYFMHIRNLWHAEGGH